MLSLEDCIALCGLSEEEVHAIAEHEHIPEMAAAEMGDYLTRTPDGELRVKAMIKEDLEAARRADKWDHELALKLMLRNFVLKHPRCEERHRRQLHRPERRAE
jgi:hypothetical protein